jgi:hypothetical protein
MRSNGWGWLVGLAVLAGIILVLIWVGPTAWEFLQNAIGVAIPIFVALLGLVLAAVVIVLLALAASWGAIQIAGSVIEQAERRPFRTLTPVLALAGGLANDLSAEAAGLDGVGNHIFAAITGLLIIVGGLLVKLGGITRVLGLFLFVLSPAAVLTAIVIRLPDRDLGAMLAQIDPLNWTMLGLFVVAALAVVVLALAADRQPALAD